MKYFVILLILLASCTAQVEESNDEPVIQNNITEEIINEINDSTEEVNNITEIINETVNEYELYDREEIFYNKTVCEAFGGEWYPQKSYIKESNYNPCATTCHLSGLNLETSTKEEIAVWYELCEMLDGEVITPIRIPAGTPIKELRGCDLSPPKYFPDAFESCTNSDECKGLCLVSEIGDWHEGECQATCEPQTLIEGCYADIDKGYYTCCGGDVCNRCPQEGATGCPEELG